MCTKAQGPFTQRVICDIIEGDLQHVCSDCLHPEMLGTCAQFMKDSQTLIGVLRAPYTDVPSRHAAKAAPAFCAVIANELKYKAPHAHTMLELVYVRWGRAAHIVYFFFAVLTNLLVSLSMLQGGALLLHTKSKN